MEDKSKLHKGVGQIKEGMGKISEGVGNIVETKVEGDKPAAKPDPAKSNPPVQPATFTTQSERDALGKSRPVPFQQPGKPAAFPGATPDTPEPKTGKAFTGFPAKEPVIGPTVDPMIEQARRVEAAHPAPTAAAVRDAEGDLAEHQARQEQNTNPKFPGPVSVSHPEWDVDDKGNQVKRATLQKPVVPGMVAMAANAPQAWRVGTMPAPEPVVEANAVAKPDPKPVPHAANVKKGEGITFIPKYKKFLAEFRASGQTYNAGMHDTEAHAIAAIATAKAHLYP